MESEQAIPQSITRIATVILAGAGTLSIVALGYVVYYYAWTRQRVLSGWPSVFLYYICPTVFAALLFATLRLGARWKVRAALALSSTFVMLYLSEALLTVVLTMPSMQRQVKNQGRAAAAKARGIPFDARTPLQVADDLRAQGTNAEISIYPSAQFEKRFANVWKATVRSNGVDMVPLAGISNRLTVLCNESGEYITYWSDQHGFNNPRNLWDKTVDIAAIGDSYVQGWCVGAEANFVSLIRQRYPATLNLGIGGDGPLSELATLKEYAEPIKPRVVLWFYFDNDLMDVGVEKASPILMRYLTDGFSQRLFGRQSEIDRALSEFLAAAKAQNNATANFVEFGGAMQALWRHPGTVASVLKLVELRTGLGLPHGKGPQPTLVDPEGVELLAKTLTEAKKSVDRWGGRLYLVFLPTWDRYVPDGIYHPGRDEVLMIASELGIPTIDLHPRFLAQEDPLAL